MNKTTLLVIQAQGCLGFLVSTKEDKIWYNKIDWFFKKEVSQMNIQQLRYVVAIANSGTFREAASKLFVSQPSLSVAIKELEQELKYQIFTRTTTGAVLTSQGMTFYERALEVVRSFDSFDNRYLNASEKGNQFSIASQH